MTLSTNARSMLNYQYITIYLQRKDAPVQGVKWHTLWSSRSLPRRRRLPRHHH